MKSSVSADTGDGGAGEVRKVRAIMGPGAKGPFTKA